MQPVFSKAMLYLPDRDPTIPSQGVANSAAYVQSLTVNGQTWNKPWLRFSDISRGGMLDYILRTKPKTNWGSDPTNAAPSFSGEPSR